jgi:predicted enzyme related to lactoylglutathione lyase
MKVTNFLVNITSEDPARLLAFYRDIVGLSPQPEMGEHALEVVPGTVLAFDGHSSTTGVAKEPQRILIDFFVDDLAAEQARLEKVGVKFIRKDGREWWGGHISTFVDPDGNYGQLIEFRPEDATAEPK